MSIPAPNQQFHHVVLTETNGEHQYSHHYILSSKKGESAYNLAQVIAATFFDEELEEGFVDVSINSYETDMGAREVSVSEVRKVTAAEAEIVKRFMTPMTSDYLKDCLRPEDLMSNSETSPDQDEPPKSETISREGLVRWDVVNGSDDALPNEPRYNLKIDQKSDGSTVIDVAHEKASEINSELPQMSLMLEINAGLPCLHVHSVQSGDSLALTLFAMPGGKISVRNGDAEQMLEKVDKGFMPKPVEVADECEAIANQELERERPRES